MSRRLRARQACYLPWGHPDNDDEDNFELDGDGDEEPAFNDDGDEWAADRACDQYEQELDRTASQ